MNESKLLSVKDEDAIGKKIDFLKASCEFFRGVDSKLLMPVAVSMQQVNFQFGDFIQKEGELPKGIYLIKSGQCNVCKTVISQRSFDPKDFPNQKKIIKDKNPLFDGFQAENSLLNNVKMDKKVN